MKSRIESYLIQRILYTIFFCFVLPQGGEANVILGQWGG